MEPPLATLVSSYVSEVCFSGGCVPKLLGVSFNNDPRTGFQFLICGSFLALDPNLCSQRVYHNNESTNTGRQS